MRLRAIREYTCQHTCKHTPPLTTTWYVVTFAGESGLVYADSHFSSMEDADFVVNAVNKRYDELGPPGKHLSVWRDDDR